jgi:hypothetical protein
MFGTVDSHLVRALFDEVPDNASGVPSLPPNVAFSSPPSATAQKIYLVSAAAHLPMWLYSSLALVLFFLLT